MANRKTCEKNYKYTLSKIIMCRNQFTGTVVTGSHREGKTAYAMKVAHDIYKNWDDVFDHMLFSLQDVKTFLAGQLRKPERAPVIIWDDTGVHANSLVYFNDPALADQIKKLFDTIGIAVRGVILTTIVQQDLLKSLRNYNFYDVKIERERETSETRRIAKAYLPKRIPSGKMFWRVSFRDYYSKLLPDDVYRRYEPIRKGYLAEGIESIDRLIEERHLQRCARIAWLEQYRNRVEAVAEL